MDVHVEPDLHPITGEVMTGASSIIQDGARLDVVANGVWGGQFERTYLDVQVFNPHAPSNRQTQMTACYRRHENIKKRAYEQRIREVEHASFTPLVLSATGGMAIQATSFYKRLATLLATRWNQPYSSTTRYVLAALPLDLFPPSVGYSMHQRCSVQLWSCYQITTSN